MRGLRILKQTGAVLLLRKGGRPPLHDGADPRVQCVRQASAAGAVECDGLGHRGAA
jgi:hypothetical protein